MKARFVLIIGLFIFASAVAVGSETTLGGLQGSLSNQAIQPAGTTPQPEGETFTIENANFVVLRGAPKLDSPAVATVDATEKLKVLERLDGWVKVSSSKGTGYMRYHYLKDPAKKTATVASPAASASAPALAPSAAAPAGVNAPVVSTGSGVASGVAGPVVNSTGNYALPGVTNGPAYGNTFSAPGVSGPVVHTMGNPGPGTDSTNITKQFEATNNAGATNVSTSPTRISDDSNAGSGRFGGRPVKGGPITSEYGPRNLYGTFHHGIDIGVPTGTPVVAVGDGKVVKRGYDPGGGNYVDVKYDNGYSARCYHLRDVTVGIGDRVSQGATIAHTNNTGAYTTGAHLHFEIRNPKGDYVNPRSVPGLSF